MPALVDRPATPALTGDAHTAWRSIQGRVDAVRRRHRLSFLAHGLLSALAVFGAAFLGFSAADLLFKLSVTARLVFFSLTLGGLLGVVFLVVLRPWVRLGGAVQAAREAEAAFPVLENQLSTALEYGGDARLTSEESSPELVGALIRQTETRSRPCDFRRIVRWRHVAWAALAAFLVGGLVALYAELSPRLSGLTWARFIRPMAAIPPPTLTVIEAVEPSGGKYPVEASVLVSATLSGRLPESATLSLQRREGPEARWEDRVMERGEDGRYHLLLRRLLETTGFKVKAGDAESGIYTLRVYREPQVDEFTVRLDYPKYTGKAPETLPPGQGDVRALRGTQLTVRLKANTELAGAQAVFQSSRTAVSATTEGSTAELSFALEKDDRYQLKISDPEGHENVSPSSYRLQALADAPPRVTIRKPGRDLMVHREQTVRVEISATDDVGVQEIGLFHTLGLEEQKTLVRRLAPTPPTPGAEGKLTWELGPMGLKGGEVIAYYAYALDNDALGGPKMAKSELHFLTVYDEEEYDAPQSMAGKMPPTPESVRRLDKMIEIQKKLLQETFVQARMREAAAPKPPNDKEKTDSARTAKAQRDLRAQLAELTEAVKQELEQLGPEPEQPKKEEEGEEPPPPQRPLGEKELKHMETAAGKMDEAAGKLDETQPPEAVRPEVEALRHLSETRRLLLSDREGDRRFKQAMNNQAKKRRRGQQQQQEEDQRAAREELAELPPMLEREKEIEREIERLEELKPESGRPQTAQEQQKEEERRSLKRKVEEALDQLSRDAQDRARRLEELAARNEELRPPGERAQAAAEKLKQAEQSAGQDQNQQARDQAHQGARDLQEAQRGIRDALEKQFRQELANLHKDAQQLAQRQDDLAQANRDTQSRSQQQQSSQPQAGQPQAGQPQAGQPQTGQPQAGQKGQEAAQRSAQASLARGQGEISEDLRDLGERLGAAAGKAQHRQLPSAQPLAEARAQADPQGPAARASQAAAETLAQGRLPEAEQEQRRAARGIEGIAQAIQEAMQKTEAADMKALAEALRKAQQLAQEQGEVNKALAGRPEPAALVAREEQVSEGARELAGATEKLEALQRQGRAPNTREQLEQASRQARAAAQALSVQDAPQAREPAKRAEQSLQAAVNEMERAAGKTLEAQARQAMAQAKDSRENQERASAAAKELPQPQAGQAYAQADSEKRDEAARRERLAARQGARLEKSLEGLEEMAQEANPMAAQAAHDARQAAQEAKLPQAMEELAEAMERLGDPARSAARQTPSPREASAQGDQLAQTLKQIERRLEQFVAEATGDQLSRLKATEQDARDASKEAESLSKQAQEQAKPQADPSQLAQRAGKLDNDLQKLDRRLQALAPEGQERSELRQARESVAQAQAQLQRRPGDPADTPTASGGPAFDKAREHLDHVSGGLVERMERILKAREVRPEEDELAPKEYRVLVERYYRALSEDVEEQK